MTPPTLVCDDEGRRLDVRAKPLNGLDYLDVADDYVTLCVHFFGSIPEGLTKANFVVDGGRRVRDIKVVSVSLDDGDDIDGDACLQVVLDRPGDGSPYRLCIVAVDSDNNPVGPYQGFDVRYSCIDFVFTAACASDFDCVPEPCPPETRPEPSLSYLAKDYESFRTLILDRLALLTPDWTERHVPDVGLTLVELLAYVGDQLSYYQDAVATEAFLDTARQRISIRRHTRLVDYHLQEGTASRAWVYVEVPAGDVVLPAGAAFVTAVPDVEDRGTIARTELPAPGGARYESFEPLVAGDAPTLRQAHNTIQFHTWGDSLCCLPTGATSATLRDGPPRPKSDPVETSDGASPPSTGEAVAAEEARTLQLGPGDILVFEEVLSPDTGNPADADPSHRHVVRLVSARPGFDELYDQPIVEVEWREEDALPFPLCISALGPAPACEILDAVSVARGNVVLVEHGRRVTETIGPVPDAPVTDQCDAPCRPAETTPQPTPFRARLEAGSPLAFSEPVAWTDGDRPAPAAWLVRQDGHAAVPVLSLTDDGHHAPPGTAHVWEARYDLLNSGPDDQHFVVEVDDDRRSLLRFGDDELGQRPAPGTRLAATYRVGGGRAGNVGAGAIAHLVVDQLGEVRGLRPRNPLPAVGGMEPEPLSDARLMAPYAFRGVLERAVTAADYATLAGRLGGSQVQRAGATLRWTGSWFRADVALDLRADAADDDEVVSAVADGLGRYRRIGHDLTVAPARTVPILVALVVCVAPGALRAHVHTDLLAVLGRGKTTSGRLGLFHPDNLTFGQSVQLSRIVATAMSVEGVDSVVVTRLERVGTGPAGEIDDGVLPIGPFEIARLDNDRSFPEQGQLLLDLRGGR